MNRHKKEDGWVRSRALVALVGLLLMAFIALLVAQDFRINDVRIDPDGKIRLRHEADTNHYYILYRGPVITNIVLATDLALGTNTVGEFVDGAVPPGSSAFYRVRQVPLNQPLDSDGDGIDDVFELTHRAFLNPLNGGDAQLDFDGDGRSNLDEYRRGTDPGVSNSPPTVSLSSPSAGGTLLAPANVTLVANAADVDGSVVLVEFFSGATKLGQSTNAPFSITLSNVAPGILTLAAKATDDFGASTTSSPTNIIVNLPPPVFIGPGPSTRGNSITLTGTSFPNTYVFVVGGAADAAILTGANGVFSIPVELQTNRLNRLFVSAMTGAFLQSAQVPFEIIQDSQPPSLYIDFPANNAELTSSNVVVAGRVGDMLSGFMGLAVTVTSQPSTTTPIPANVDVGIGNNGTFEQTVPLALGTNLITATGSDIQSNTVTRQITVVRVPLVGPRMFVISGDRQMTNVHRPLLQPVAVRVTQVDGVTPITNKPITFEVTRSDGRLLPQDTNYVANNFTLRPDANASGTTFLQLFTDANGEAKALWTLGGDAGCGNNRVCVSSKDISGTTFFCASAKPALPGQLNIGSGNNQRAEAGGPAPEPLKVWVSDSCNGVPNIPVTFTVTQGGGKVNGTNSVTITTSVTGHAQVGFTLGTEGGNNVVEANTTQNRGSPASFVIYGLVRDAAKPTTLTGLVLDNANQPIGHALCEVFLPNSPSPEMLTYSDTQGRFSFENPPTGPVHLFIYGASANTVGTNSVPAGFFPFLTYFITLIPNAENTLPRPVLLPRLNPKNSVWYNGTSNLVLTCEGIAGLKMTIKANSMRDARGLLVTPQNPAQVSLNQVHHDLIPMPIPDGASPPFAWTLQPGRSTFDPPIQIEYPNMTGLPAGNIAYFLSFNHDTERFEIVASGHVTSDSSTIVTDAGAGLSVAGWGCNCPPYSVTGNCKNNCPYPVRIQQIFCGFSNGEQHWLYRWESSTGNLSDLADCELGETVELPCGPFDLLFNSFAWPAPWKDFYTNPGCPYEEGGKWGNFSCLDCQGNGLQGCFPDTQRSGFGAIDLNNLRAASFTATQYIWYKSLCNDGGVRVNLLGPIFIQRSINEQVDGNGHSYWEYKITKSGQVNVIRLTP